VIEIELDELLLKKFEKLHMETLEQKKHNQIPKQYPKNKKMNFYFVVIFSLFVAYVSSIPTSPCAISQTFSGRIRVVGFQSQCMSMVNEGDIYFDYVGQQIRMDSDSSNFQTTSTNTVWLFYSMQMMYVLDHSTGKCNGYPMNNQVLNPPVIPTDSILMDEFLIGSQAVDRWQISNDEDTAMNGVVSVTSDNCFFVDYMGFNSTSGALQVIESFSDFIPDVPMYIFDMPDSCNSLKPSKPKKVELSNARKISFFEAISNLKN